MTITALLGPTNTGKTHQAIERMLEHRTGMMGLPLRLLAREVYDRVSTQVGEAQVALVTGEEKRVPPRPRYWVCTVEAMPIRNEVDFLAVDEIQLAAHPERGHVFTERLLSARGLVETWFMGAETMRDAMKELVPTATIRNSPRLSTLRGVSPSTLASLPKRSAVVAFSLTRVFELADRLRTRRGGAAVVIGALSPRARNAQVALYQAKEVDFLVATDAIGMGLNLDIDHVAFADMRKFDGRIARDLDPAELAQIAGRAGRYVKDGTFGTIAPLPELPLELRRAIEGHRFASVRNLQWRNADLAYESLEDLLASLRRPSTVRRLKRAERALDEEVLAALAEQPDVLRLARGEANLRLLWAACSIPDYRQLLFEEHVALVGRVFAELATRGRLARSDVEEELDRIERSTSDLETLMDRIASIRTWNFVAHQGGWVDGAEAVRERARKIEDDLSDALHDALVTRFVERGRPVRAASIPKAAPSRPKNGAPPAPQSDPHAAGASPFAKLATLRASLRRVEPDRVDDEEMVSVEAMIEAGFEQFGVDEHGHISFEGRRVAKLVAGRSVYQPDVVVSLELDAGAKLRLTRRLVAWSRDLVHEIVGAVTDLEELGSNARGLVHLITSGLGTVLVREARTQLDALDARDEERLIAAGLVRGRVALYLPSALKPAVVTKRAALLSAVLGLNPPRKAPQGARLVPRWPLEGERSLAPSRDVPLEAYAAVGYPVIGKRAIRADLIERIVHRLLAEDASEDEETVGTKVASWIGCRASEAAEIVELLKAAMGA